MSRSLYESAAKGDLGLLERALNGEFGQLAPQDIGQALLRAANNGEKVMVARLLQEDQVDINFEDMDGDTPLMLAASNNHLDVLKQLMKAGCDINLQSDRERTAMHMAAWNGRMKVLKVLLQAGCSLNLQDRYGDTALMMCARRGSADIMKVLLQAGSDVNTRSYERDTALHYAAHHGHTKCVALLLQYSPDLEAATLFGHTPVLLAGMGGHDHTASVLLYAGASACVADRSEKSLLQYASKRGLIECVQIVLKNGQSPDVADTDNMTPCFEAVRANNPCIVKLLVQHGCHVSSVVKTTLLKQYRYWTYLEAALVGKSRAIMELLVAAGAGMTQLSGLSSSAADDVDTLAWLVEKVSAPLSLTAQCRLAVREALGTRTPYAAQSLPLPSVVKQFLLFEDIWLDDQK